ncbi:MAG: hypothetical protein Q8P95_02845 [bacterium]|nr:hypothetical protein [bacterium]
MDFIYHIYSAAVKDKPEVKISDEHQGYQWLTPQACLNLPLIEDEDACIRIVYGL